MAKWIPFRATGHASGWNGVSVANADDRLLLLGISEEPLVLDVIHPEQPVQIEAVLLKDRKGGQALYLTPGVSRLLVVEPSAIKLIE